MKVIDACGRACPEPVVMTKQALQSGEPAYEVLVDNATAQGNVTRFAQSNGYSVSDATEGEVVRLTLKK